MTKDPSNAVLLEKIMSLHESLARVERQTTMTNGRVTKLEGWKNRLVGALVITNILIVPVVTALILKLF